MSSCLSHNKVSDPISKCGLPKSLMSGYIAPHATLLNALVLGNNPLTACTDHINYLSPKTPFRKNN